MPLVLFPRIAKPGRAHAGRHSGCAFMALKAGVRWFAGVIGPMSCSHPCDSSVRTLDDYRGDPISTDGLTTRDADALTVRLYDEIGKITIVSD